MSSIKYEDIYKISVIRAILHRFSTSYKHKKMQQLGTENQSNILQRSSINRMINVSVQFEV